MGEQVNNCPRCGAEMEFRLGQNECPSCNFVETHRIPTKQDKVRPSKIRDLVEGMSGKDSEVTRGTRGRKRGDRSRRESR